MSKESFKNFIRTKPELVEYVTNGEMTWQKFYELYDIYGEDNNIWDKVKYQLMYADVYAKFSQNEDLKNFLLSP